MGEFLTFNTEAQAKLQAERALERIAEVKAMLAEKEVLEFLLEQEEEERERVLETKEED